MSASGVVTDLPEFADRCTDASGRIVITVNRSDNNFIEKHLCPFLGHSALSRESHVVEARNALLIFGDWGAGHVMPEKGLIRYLMQSMGATEGDDFDALELKRLLPLSEINVQLDLKKFRVQCSASTGVDFAFYLFKDSERIYVQPYGKDCSFYFERYVSSGEYRIRVFARDLASKHKRIYDTNAFSLAPES